MEQIAHFTFKQGQWECKDYYVSLGG